MDWKKTIGKGVLAILTFLGAYLAANTQVLVNLIPEGIREMTIGSIVASLIVMITNWLKHRDK